MNERMPSPSMGYLGESISQLVSEHRSLPEYEIVPVPVDFGANLIHRSLNAVIHSEFPDRPEANDIGSIYLPWIPVRYMYDSLCRRADAVNAMLSEPRAHAYDEMVEHPYRIAFDPFLNLGHRFKRAYTMTDISMANLLDDELHHERVMLSQAGDNPFIARINANNRPMVLRTKTAVFAVISYGVQPAMPFYSDETWGEIFLPNPTRLMLALPTLETGVKQANLFEVFNIAAFRMAAVEVQQNLYRSIRRGIVQMKHDLDAAKDRSLPDTTHLRIIDQEHFIPAELDEERDRVTTEFALAYDAMEHHRDTLWADGRTKSTAYELYGSPNSPANAMTFFEQAAARIGEETRE